MIRCSLCLFAVLVAGCKMPQCCPPTPDGSCQQESDSCREIHVNAPRQRIRVQREAPAGDKKLVEQQIAQTRQVMLVPQQVYVPFVQATNFSAVRVSGTEQTQVFNAQGVVQGVNIQGVQGGGTGGTGGGAGRQSVDGADPQAQADELRKCREERDLAMKALRELNGQLMNLDAELKQLKKNMDK